MGIRLVEPEAGTHHATRARAPDGVNAEMLKSYVDRIMSLHEQRISLADDVAEIIQEATSNGFNKPALKATVKIASEDMEKREKRRATDDVLGVYLSALGLA
jgi:uncharacterized protein (UPF0335 family)